MSLSFYRALVATLCVVLLAACTPERADFSVTGQIEGSPIAVGSRIGGRVEAVLLEEGDSVKAGDVLLRLEADELRAKLEAACAQLAAADAQLVKLEAGAREEEIRAAAAAMDAAKAEYDMAVEGARSKEIDAARAEMEAAEAVYIDARDEYKRMQRLYEDRTVPESQRDHAKQAAEASEKRFESAKDRFELLLEGTRDEHIAMAKAKYDGAVAQYDLLKNGTRVEDIAAAKASRDAAAAGVAQAEVALREMVITSPISGTVESLDVHPGDLVSPGPVARVIDSEDLELWVYVGAVRLGDLSVGEGVVFTTDAHEAEEFEGTIEFIASEGEFTPRNLQTEEERVQQVFAVKIGFGSADGKLRPGMAATVHFEGR